MSILFMLFLLNLGKVGSVENYSDLMPSALISYVPSYELEQRSGLDGIKECIYKKKKESRDQMLLIREASVLLGDVCIQLQADSSYANTANFLFYFISGA